MAKKAKTKALKKKKAIKKTVKKSVKKTVKKPAKKKASKKAKVKAPKKTIKTVKTSKNWDEGIGTAKRRSSVVKSAKIREKSLKQQHATDYREGGVVDNNNIPDMTERRE